MAEKKLTEIPRPQRELYEKGNVALQRQNLDYAIAILNQVLQKEPGFFDARQTLRAAQFKKKGAGGGFFKKMLSGASSSPLIAKAQMTVRRNPLEALQICEQILNNDPENAGAHKILAEAALAAELPKTACLSLEILLKNDPKDVELGMRYGEALAADGQILKAERVYSDLLRAHPSDNDISQALKNLSARKSMEEGGYEEAAEESGTYREMLRNREEAAHLEREQRQFKSEETVDRLLDEYEARLQNEPNNFKLLRNIAELLAQKKDFDRSLEFYERLRASEAGNDPSLERAISETQSRKFDYLISHLDPNDPAQAEKAVQLRAEQQEYQLTECRGRAERYPNDLQIRYELGELYFKAGKYTEAIQEFQRAQNNPQRRVQAMAYLGRCFSQRGMNDLAARTLQNAIKEKAVFDDEKKDLIYNLGTVLEKMGKKEEAIEQYKLIYEQDIGYKDVAAKVDAYYSGGGAAS